MKPLLLQTLRGDNTPRRPVWIMRQAGRYLPEYRKLREDHTFEQMCADPALAAEVTMQPLRRFPLDAAIVFADLMSPVPAMGLEVRFDPGPVLARPVQSARDVRDLREPHPDEVGTEVIETLKRVKSELADDVTLLGFGGAPWSLAAYLVQGHGKKGFPLLRTMMAAQPELLHELMEKLTRIVAGYLIRQHQAGADAVQVFDSWAGLLSAEDFRHHVRPHLHALLAELRQAGVPRILFVQGAPHLTDECQDLPFEALALCWRSDLAEVRRSWGDDRVLQGNLDPAVLLGGPEVTRAATRNLLAHVPARGHIMNLGHGILPETPIESVQALLEVVHGEENAS